MTKKCFLCGEQWKSNRSSAFDITFHALPTSNETRKKWLDSLQWNEPLEPFKHYFVCSRHFAKDDLVNNNLDPFSRTRIRRGAIPTILNPRSVDFYQTNKDEATSSSGDDATSTDTESTVTATSVSESDSPLNSFMNTATTFPLNETKANAFVNNLNSNESENTVKVFTGSSESDSPSIPCTCAAVILTLNKTVSSASVNNLETTNSGHTAKASTSSKSESTSISKTFNFGKRKIGERLKYFGDFNMHSLNSKSKRRKFFEISNRTILDLRKKNKLLQAQVRRLKKSAYRETTGVIPEYLSALIDENTSLDYLEPSGPSPSESNHDNYEFNHRDHDYAIDPVETIHIVCTD